MAVYGGSIPIGLYVPAVSAMLITLYMAFKASFIALWLFVRLLHKSATNRRLTALRGVSLLLVHVCLAAVCLVAFGSSWQLARVRRL
jgi:hypothetical protein